MNGSDIDAPGTLRNGPDPDSTDASTVAEREWIVPNQQSRPADFKSDLLAPVCPVGTKLIHHLEYQPRCVRPVGHQLRVVCLHQETILGRIGGEGARECEAVADIPVNPQLRVIGAIQLQVGPEGRILDVRELR